MFKIRHLEENKPPLDESLNTAELKKYHENWGREGDKALIAVRDMVM